MNSKTFLNIPKEKQDRVLRAAQIEFAKYGYHKANIDDICERAGISNGALYKYFKNKADVYESVINRQIKGKDEYMRSVLHSKGTCFDKIRKLMKNTLTEREARNDTFRIILQLGTSDMDSFARKVTRRIEATSFKNIQAILIQGIEKGEVRPDIDIEMTTHLISSLCFFIYSGFVSEFHRLRLEEFFHAPFSGDETSHNRLVKRMMAWLKKMIALESPNEK
jgi:TetR/AcrR family transcriptional regulator